MKKALHSGDFAASARLMPASRAEEIEQMRSSPDLAYQLEMARALSPTQVRITGDRASVEFTALESDHPGSAPPKSSAKAPSGSWSANPPATRTDPPSGVRGRAPEILSLAPTLGRDAWRFSSL